MLEFHVEGILQTDRKWWCSSVSVQRGCSRAVFNLCVCHLRMKYCDTENKPEGEQ